jgi:hypothetical protein
MRTVIQSSLQIRMQIASREFSVRLTPEERLFRTSISSLFRGASGVDLLALLGLARVTQRAENVGSSDLVENRRRVVLHHANLFCYDVLHSLTSRSLPSGGKANRRLQGRQGK